MTSKQIIAKTERFGAPNYKPLPIVIERAQGAVVYDPEGNQYVDMLAAYSAVNQGHCHPTIIAALKEQAERITITSRAFHSTTLGDWYEQLCRYTGKNMILPMNTGAEAVETAMKAARRWGYQIKGIPDGRAEIIACTGNFHGRTLAAVSMSSEEAYKAHFGPMLPGIKLIPYGNIEALREAISEQTAAFIVEPIQGEAGIVIPPAGFLREAAALCKERNVLFIADEIQTGLGRTGKRFACDWEDVVPDVYILGKALGGGVLPISAVAADSAILQLFQAGSHGSTFGGNPLACAVSMAALRVLEEEQLTERSRTLGDYFLGELQKLTHPAIKEVRGRGLFIGLELHEAARPYCEALARRGLLCKETHDTVIRFAPPLVISKEQLQWALTQIADVFQT